MKYYIISNNIFKSEQLPNSSQYPDTIELNVEQIAFYLANPTANVNEVLAMELEPIPEPTEPTEPEPTIEERQEAIEDALDELIQYVYGGAHWDQ